jgi:hypothetical protein
VKEAGSICGACGGDTPDMSTPPPASPDMATGGGGGKGGVGTTGGTVSLLHFGITGDTRPPSCEDTAGYPTAIIDSIGDAFKQRSAQFVLDLGDHMYVCNNDLTVARAHMSLFMQGTAHFGGTWFMTMGNHECYGGPCLPGSTNANYVAFMEQLAPVSAQVPYYSFDVHTSLGLVTFVVVADNAWSTSQASWLDATLAKADQDAKYTIVSRHHPEGDSSVTTNSASMQIIRNHKFALFLTGHSHLYKHETTDNGRDLVLGTGGAPLIAAGTFYGYGMIDQQPDGKLAVTIFDVSNGSQMDAWSVGPN